MNRNFILSVLIAASAGNLFADDKVETKSAEEKIAEAKKVAAIEEDIKQTFEELEKEISEAWDKTSKEASVEETAKVSDEASKDA